MCSFVGKYTVSADGFSTGIAMFYWSWAEKHELGVRTKNAIKSSAEQFRGQRIFNYNDLGGYSPSELFIKTPKYADLKQEILSNLLNEVGAAEYDHAMFKARRLSATKRAKKLTAGPDTFLHCGIAEGSGISVAELLSFILYTDFDTLSSRMSASLRKNNPVEPLQSVKRRNASYWHMSKTLKESVCIFGEDGSRSNGPFFCGMDRVLAVPEFAIRLFAPTSTSRSLEVATLFANDGGCVLGLNNTNGSAGGLKCKFFNVSWLSRYPEEQERLFMGGEWPIQIESIRVLEGNGRWRCFREHFNLMFWFDAVCSGSALRNMKSCLKGKEVYALSCLLNAYDNDREQPKYVRDCFQYYGLCKKSMVLNLGYLDKYCPSEFMPLLFDSFGGQQDQDNITYHDSDDLTTNMMKGAVLNCFPNLQELIIFTTNEDGTKSYVSSLDKWFELFCTQEQIQKCTLHGTWKDAVEIFRCDLDEKHGRRSWLHYRYESMGSSLRTATVTSHMRKTEDANEYVRDSLVFERI